MYRNIIIKQQVCAVNVGCAEFLAFDANTQKKLNAEVFIDNVYKEVTTPITISEISVGSHTFTYKLDGYDDILGNFKVNLGKVTRISEVMYPIGTLASDTGFALIGIAVGLALLYIVTRKK